jgi:periplasmic protein TonB
MEIKKHPSKDLEIKKSLFFQIGLVVALFVILVAFEWKQYDEKDDTIFDLGEIILVEEEIEITRQEQPEPPPPPQAPDIEIVEDDVEVEDDLTFDDFEDNKPIEEIYVSRVEVQEEVVVEQEIFTIVEEQPSFPGGEAALMEYLGKNITYPPMARESGIQGTVFVTFVVEPDGNVTNVRTLRGIGGGCDEEAIRVVRNMPRWVPGKQRGKPVRVQFNLPIRFVLQG